MLVALHRLPPALDTGPTGVSSSHVTRSSTVGRGAGRVQEEPPPSSSLNALCSLTSSSLTWMVRTEDGSPGKRTNRWESLEQGASHRT